VRPEGRIDLILGTLSSGQGHATSFAQLLVEWFGVALADVRLITGDTDVTVTGGGAHSARALRMAAIVMAKASDQIVDKGRRIAARLLEAAEDDIEFSARCFRVKGTDRSVDLYAVAAAAERLARRSVRRSPHAAVVPLRLRGVRGRGRSRHRRRRHRCATRRWTTAGAR
jgi:carbon-monoxide dehydrogenase large subunit